MVIFRKTKNYFLKLFFTIICGSSSDNIKFKKQDVKNVLIAIYTGVGNFILFTPTLKALKLYLPRARFTLLYGGKTGFEQVVKGSNLIDDYILVKRESTFWDKLSTIVKIRKSEYDLVVNEFHASLFIKTLTALSGAEYLVGHVSSPGIDISYDNIYNIPAKMRLNQHEIDRYIELIIPLGIKKTNIDKKTFFYISTTERKFANNFFKKYNLNSKKVIGIQAGSNPAAYWKRWNKDKFSKIGDLILNLDNTEVILLGSPSEIEIVHHIEKNMKNTPINIAGKTSIKQVAAIINMIDLLICNDSGLMHIGVAVDTPVIAIYGPTDYTRTAPLGKKHTIIRKKYECSPCFKFKNDKVLQCPFEYKCLADISVDEVYDNVELCLKK